MLQVAGSSPRWGGIPKISADQVARPENIVYAYHLTLTYVRVFANIILHFYYLFLLTSI
jgi:hypothetical protein